ncbi:hypothetical protein Fot_32345 [Forsythia ovata]|uniref:Uncharacterized protein n=1 Tax=Forsythia ovata TaxID=205694 RepID=A0ABD1T824_9LAMI
MLLLKWFYPHDLSSQPIASSGAVDSSHSFGMVGDHSLSAGIKFSLEGMLGSLPLITNDNGPSYLGQAKRRKIASKAKRKVGDKNNLISTYGLAEDVYFDLPRDIDPM